MGPFELRNIKELAADIVGTKTCMIPRYGLHHMLRQRIEDSALQVLMV